MTYNTYMQYYRETWKFIMKTVLKKSDDIKINTDGVNEKQKKPGQKMSQLKQWHILISILSSVRQQPHFALLQI
jgi:hypothetical protein